MKKPTGNTTNKAKSQAKSDNPLAIATTEPLGPPTSVKFTPSEKLLIEARATDMSLKPAALIRMITVQTLKGKDVPKLLEALALPSVQ